MSDKKFKYIKYFLFVLVGVLIFAFLCSIPAPASRILNIQSSLITVSGIISGIVIAYLSAKLFNLKQERQTRQVEIDKLAEKLTNFRRILYCVMHSYGFWKYYSDVTQFKKEYPDVNFEQLEDQSDETKEMRFKFWDEKNTLNNRTIYLYLAMEAIYGKDVRLTWIYDRSGSRSEPKYDLEKLYLFYEPLTTMDAYLNGTFNKHTDGLINDNDLINSTDKDKVLDWLCRIDNKFRGKSINKNTVSDLASDFHQEYIPRLIQLTKNNQNRFPVSILIIFRNLVWIFGIGVIWPLFIQSLDLCDKLNIILTLIAVFLIVLGFISFLIDFYKIMYEEMETT